MLVIGLIFAVIGACTIWFLGADVTLTCKRSTDTCILEKTGMLGRKEVVASLPLSRVKSAEVESRKGSINKDGRRGKPTYQVVLRTDDGSIPFSNAWTREREAHQRIASDINTYLGSSQESFSIVQSGKSVRLVGWLFLAGGSFAFFRGLRGVLKMWQTFRSVLSARG